MTATPIFELKQVGYHVADRQILHDVNLTVNAGEHLTIAGPSGSGKSTLLRVLATLLTATSGTINFLGNNQATYEKINYRRQVSYCFQQPSLFGETVKDNLEFPFRIRSLDFDQTRAEQALASVDLKPALLNSRIRDLSGGEKQRVALTRNLLFTPQVLLLDEITTGLDTETKHIVYRLIDRMNTEESVTIISVTHDEGEIADAQRLVTIADGTVEANHD